jgi:hypothetical protein
MHGPQDWTVGFFFLKKKKKTTLRYKIAPSGLAYTTVGSGVGAGTTQPSALQIWSLIGGPVGVQPPTLLTYITSRKEGD